ncbi:hypothetical protein J3R83DRAFT_4159 [Lanmaoa asiatica]|nr:hypothetical protein J3R83DRAFT_4159 [Lanmaoa asiatica]
MSEGSQPEPIRIVYHAQNRTFARLFNERSLEEVKDVVRRKLRLGRETDVFLKQMGPNAALLDLEDEDDFQAFRVLLRSSVSVDIQVIVGGSRGPPVPPPVAFVSRPASNLGDVLKRWSSQQPRERLPVSEPITVESASPSRQPAADSATSGQSAAHPEVASVKTPVPSARKRKVSFGDVVPETPDKPAERRTVKKSAIAVASAETAASPAVPKPVGAEEPPKKKQKKAATKAKDVQPTEAIESSPAKDSGAPTSKPKKSTALDRASEAGTSAPKDAETSEPPARKQRKKDDGTSPKKSSAPVDQGGIDQSISQPNDPVDEASLQPASEKPKGTIPVGGTSKTLKSGKTKPKGTACAAIPRTSASTSVQSEVAAAILSGLLSKTSETVPPEPPTKRKSVKKTTKNSSASSSPLLVESTTVLDSPANGIPNVPTEQQTSTGSSD